MFEKASRLKLRFETPKGSLTVEDLWDLPLTTTAGRACLNDIAKGISRRLKEAGDEDFVDTAKRPDEMLQLALDIVKRVIAVRLEEADVARKAADRRQQKGRIMELIAQKRDADLQAKPLEELEQMVAAL